MPKTLDEIKLKCDPKLGGCGSKMPALTMAVWLEHGTGEALACSGEGCTRSWAREDVAEVVRRAREMTRTTPEPKTLARTSHPSTSHVDEDFLRDYLPKARAHALGAVKDHPGSTCTELATAVGDHGSRTIGRRLNELEKDGLVRRGPPRKCSVTGRKAATWF